MMNEYLIRYIDYYFDTICEEMVYAENREQAVDTFKKTILKYWKIVDVILIKENVR